MFGPFLICEFVSALGLASVNDDEQHQYGDEDYRRQGSQLGGETALACIGVDVGGEGLKSDVALGEEAHGKVVDREREREDEATDDAWLDLGDDDLAQCLEGCSAEVEGRLIDIGVHAREARHHAEHHVGGAEGDVGKDYRSVALRYAQCHEEQEERDTGDDVGVDEGYVVEEVDRLSLAVLQVVDAYGGHAAQHGSDGRGYQGNDDGVLYGTHQRVRHAPVKEVGVELQGEARPVAQHLRLGEREDGNDENRGVEDCQQQPQIPFG